MPVYVAMPRSTRKRPAFHYLTLPQAYQGFDENSGVSAYALGHDFIVVEFRHDGRYLYTHAAPGRRHVETMKKLARAGHGLATYINQHVRTHYAEKLA